MALSAGAVAGYVAGSAVVGFLTGAATEVIRRKLRRDDIDEVKSCVQEFKNRAGTIRLESKFELVKRVGGGGFGEVKAWRRKEVSKNSDYYIAVKEVAVVNVTNARMLLDEADRLSRLEHENIVGYIASYVDPSADKVYLFMELLMTSVGNMAKKAPMMENDARLLTCDIMNGMIYMHEQNIVHCDIKGDNVLLDEHGKAMICDFGISQFAANDSAASTSRLQGSMPYMSPEIIDGRKPGRRSDLWAVGCVVLEMLNRRPPFSTLHAPAMMRKISDLEHREVVKGVGTTDVQDFLLSIFVNLDDRPYPKLLRNHKWLAESNGALGISPGLITRINGRPGKLRSDQINEVKRCVQEMRKKAKGVRLENKFELVRSIGSGKFGRVGAWGKKKVFGKSNYCIAVKEFSTGNITDARALMAEADKLSECEHDNIVAYITSYVDQSAGKVYLFTELLKTSVGQMAKKASISESDARLLTCDIMDGMIYIHEKNFLHSNMKGENVLLDAQGRAMISDFGISGFTVDNPPSSTKHVAGTMPYMSPELLDGGAAGKRSDLWAVGCVILEMLDQRPPFAAISQTVMMRNIRDLKHREVAERVSSTQLQNFLLSIFVRLEERPYPESLRKHKWLAQCNGAPAISTRLIESIKSAVTS